jgi:hypothetical protein
VASFVLSLSTMTSRTVLPPLFVMLTACGAGGADTITLLPSGKADDVSSLRIDLSPDNISRKIRVPVTKLGCPVGIRITAQHLAGDAHVQFLTDYFITYGGEEHLSLVDYIGSGFDDVGPEWLFGLLGNPRTTGTSLVSWPKRELSYRNEWLPVVDAALVLELLIDTAYGRTASISLDVEARNCDPSVLADGSTATEDHKQICREAQATFDETARKLAHHDIRLEPLSCDDRIED